MRILNSALAAAALLLVSASVRADEEYRPVRVDFECTPEATVCIDGAERGTTPFSCYDLRPGAYHLRMTAKGCEPFDGTLTVAAGDYLVERHQLKALKGLLLLQSEPAGCQVELDGVSLGETPRFLAHLDVHRTYFFTLSKSGYKSKKIEVKLEDRVPVVRQETLQLDSGAFDIASEPAGAEVYFNGIRRGTTPLKVDFVPKGRTDIRIAFDGYDDYRKSFEVQAGTVEKLAVVLKARPGSLELSAKQLGVEFRLGEQVCGKGRVTLDKIQPGDYAVTASLAGYAAETRTVTVRPGGRHELTFDLVSDMGALVVRTIPAGAQVFVNGKSYGHTKAEEGAGEDKPSMELRIENLLEGEYEVLVRADGFADKSRRHHVGKRQNTACNFRLNREFTPNVEIVTQSGSTIRGVYLDKNAAGIMIETAPGVTRTFQPSEIRKLDFLVGTN